MASSFGLRLLERGLELPNQRLDHMRLVDIRQTFVTAVVIESQAFVIEAQLMQYCGVQIGGLSAVGNGSIAKIVGCSIRLTSANPPPASHTLKPYG